MNTSLTLTRPSSLRKDGVDFPCEKIAPRCSASLFLPSAENHVHLFPMPRFTRHNGNFCLRQNRKKNEAVHFSSIRPPQRFSKRLGLALKNSVKYVLHLIHPDRNVIVKLFSKCFLGSLRNKTTDCG